MCCWQRCVGRRQDYSKFSAIWDVQLLSAVGLTIEFLRVDGNNFSEKLSYNVIEHFTIKSVT